MPSNSTGFRIPFDTIFPDCVDGTDGTTINMSFWVLHGTVWGEVSRADKHAIAAGNEYRLTELQNTFVVGNISELGNWDPYHAVAMNADEYTSFGAQWLGGDITIAAGVPFEYKYITWGLNANLTWECGENRVYAGAAPTCDPVIVDEWKAYYRDGNYIACDNLASE